MSPEQDPTHGDADREPASPPGRPWGRAVADSAPALVVLAIPLVIVPVASPFVGGPVDGGRWPVWAVEAFGADRLRRTMAAAELPAPILLAYGLVPLIVPTIGALVGQGTVGRWAALAGFCLVGAGLCGLLGLGVLLELVAPGSTGLAPRLGLLTGLSGPLLGLEACGCLLASSAAPSRLESRPDRLRGRSGLVGDARTEYDIRLHPPR